MVNVKATENKARRIMKMDTIIWEQNNWQSGDDVKLNTYENELRRLLVKAKISKVPDFYYFIFEDANFHTLNEGLESIRRFESKNPSENKFAEQQYEKYLDAGGKTWALL